MRTPAKSAHHEMAPKYPLACKPTWRISCMDTLLCLVQMCPYFAGFIVFLMHNKTLHIPTYYSQTS